MSEHFGGKTSVAERQEILKNIILDLKNETDVSEAKKKFARLIKDVSPDEIANMEQALINEGLPVSEVQRMCDVHVEVFKESLEKGRTPKTLAGHPVKTFKEENRAAKKAMKRLKRAAKKRSADFGDALSDVRQIEQHYLRKENLLFPLLEKTGFDGPSKVMWGKHDEIREMLKKAEGDDYHSALQAVRAMGKMIFMEEKILFPTALRKLDELQWAEIRNGEHEIGYSWIQPGNLWDANIVMARQSEKKPEPSRTESTPATGFIPLDTGALTPDRINLMLKNIPLDMTYVDENDRVLYYSQGRERIFPRTPAIIGRSVQNCHPPKSVHIVQGIIDDFKKGTRDTAEFWLTMGGKFIHIRYYPMFAEDGSYKGVLEVTQDVTAIRALEGEKRLLD